MDLDFENINSEGKSAQPLIYPVTDVIKFMEEATTDGIRYGTLGDETTKFSKPQADRALSNALKYGIFEMRKNQPKITNQFLDDVDTIYWQACSKHEETPYRLDNNCDYINPEKDRHRFRKFTVSDDDKKTSNRKVKTFFNEAKGRSRNTLPQKTTRHCKINKIYGRNKSQKAGSKWNGIKQEKINKQKRNFQPRRSIKEKRKKNLYIRKAQVKNNSKMRASKLLHKKVYDEKFITNIRKTKSQFPQCRKYVLENSEDDDDDEEINYQNANENSFMYGYNEEEKEDNFHELSNSEDNDDKCICEHFICVPHHLHKCCNSYQAHNLKCFQKCSNGSAKKKYNSAKKIKKPIFEIHFTEHLEPTVSKYQNKPENEYQCPAQEVSSNYSIYNMQLVGNYIKHSDTKGDWLSNKLSKAQEKTIKQFDNTLKIEPMDSLSCKNLENTSYIS